MSRITLSRLRLLPLAAAALSVLVACSSSLHAASPGFTYKKIVDSTTQVPTEAAGVKYQFFGRPAINQSNIAYRAAFKNLSNVTQHEVDRVTPAGVILLVQKAGAGTGIISDPTIYGTSVAYSGMVTSGQNTAAIYSFGNGLAADGKDNEEAPTIYDGRVVYPRRSVTSGSGPNNIHIAVTSGGSSSSTVLVDQTTLVPGGGGQFFAQFDAYLDHSLNSGSANGSVAFMGVWSSGPASHGIYRWDQMTNSVVVIADKNTPIPGQSGNFTTMNSALPFITPISGFNGAVGNMFSVPQSFYNQNLLNVSSRPSLYGRAVSFNYDDGPRAGIYQRITGPLTTIADINTNHPTLPGKFKDFFESSTVGGSVAFTATDETGLERGLFLAQCGKILQVAAAGDVIDGKLVTSVDLGHRGLSVKNGSKLQSSVELAFWVSFGDNTQAIYTASISQLCISPAVIVGAGTGSGQTQAGTVFGSHSFISPVFDDLTSRLRVEMTASAGGVVPATFGGNADADVLGVDSLPGNNPLLIDFVPQLGSIIPEAMDVKFNQPMLISEIHLDSFDANDSAILHIGSHLFAVNGAAYPDGRIPFADLLLNEGEPINISWDPTNASGDGFSFGGIMATAVPEPSSVLLIESLIGILALTSRRGMSAKVGSAGNQPC